MSEFTELTPIESNLAKINTKINEILAYTGRAAEATRLLVVTKGQPVEKIQTLINAGGVLLGENYPEETARKIPLLTGLNQVHWHMIGHIQSRKIKFLVQYFDVIESVESLETAKKLNDRFSEVKRKTKILLEVNLSGELSKQGFDLVDQSAWNSFYHLVQMMRELDSLEVTGLMIMPPLGDTAEDSRPYFRKCRELGDFINQSFGRRVISELSMGTSFDYTVAVEEGSTIVRVGEAIMGPRNYT